MLEIELAPDESTCPDCGETASAFEDDSCDGGCGRTVHRACAVVMVDGPIAENGNVYCHDCA